MVFWQTKDNLGIGSKAPNFTLPSQSGELVNLTDLLDRKPVVMVFQQYKEQLPELRFRALLTKDGTRHINLTRA